MNSGILVLITGKSASGKDTVQNILCSYFKYNKVPKYTTRPLRADEEQGEPYIFVDKETFFKMQDKNDKDREMIISNFNGWYYGYSWKDIDNTENPIMVVDNVQLAQVLENCIQKPIVIYLERNDTERYISQLNRGTSISEVYRRSIHDDAAFQTVINDSFTYRVYNTGHVSDTITDILEIIAHETDDGYTFFRERK